MFFDVNGKEMKKALEHAKEDYYSFGLNNDKVSFNMGLLLNEDRVME